MANVINGMPTLANKQDLVDLKGSDDGALTLRTNGFVDFVHRPEL
jgi:hypothetical protein